MAILEPAPPDAPQTPPCTLSASLRCLGPGMILAGAIVGSGELIATPKVGAEAGFWLLWLIILGCTLKVFVQIEFGRHTITWGQTALAALDSLPGPRWKVNWLLWYWFAVVLLIISQNGGIVGGVGQALSMAMPITADGEEYNRVQDDLVRARVVLAEARREAVPAAEVASLEQSTADLSLRAADLDEPHDELLWATVVALLTSVIMWFGRYKFIEIVSTLLVGAFTVVTLIALYMLQSTPWAVSAENVAQGLRFRLPPGDTTGAGLATALSAFGMIGLSAGEIIMYPYWCLEKGYAAHTGPRAQTPEWAARASGWMRVLQLDVWLSMFVYTFSTVAFYLLGAAVLGRTALSPEGEGMIRTLAQMYVPVFGEWAEGLFLFGAVTVLYSTYFVFAAGFARIIADALILLGLINDTAASRALWRQILSVSLPLLALVVFLFVRAPVEMVLAAGLGQATVLPMLGAAALYFRYYRIDTRLRPPLISDMLLWLSFAGLLIIGVWSLYSNFVPRD
ncbi:MAG: Nramp family divalent metal transporter [Pirellulales bacterium]